MSEAPAGMEIAEKFFGLIAIIIGALTVYYSSTSPPDVPPGVPSAAWLSGIFVVAGLVLIGVGVFLMLAKVE